MSRTIDERVVEMRFDNREFEANIDTSINSINKLNKSLDLKGASKGLENVNAASKGVGVGIADLGTVVEGVGAKFSAFQIMATTALVNLTNSAVNAGKRMAMSLSVDQITAGWSKYEQKTANVQTLMNSTGKSIDEINGYLDKLMWFSDETSYGFTDMTAALAQMTSSGGDIEKLIPMITGVANATAYAGKGANEFSRVIYNLNQSYGAGYLQLMDWKSLELAGVGSLQLKQTIIDTAVQLGKIKEGQVTVANFAETLKDKWADTEVMEGAFGKFGEFSDAVREMVASGEVDTAADAIEKLSGQYGELGEKAFRSAQEAKSFSEAIDATKDAVSSGWLRSFEIIFGNYEESKVIWTDLANTLWDVFASGAEARNELLQGWKDLGGRTDMLESIANIFHTLQAVIGPVSKAFAEMFPPVTSERLYEITTNFKKLTENIKLFFTENEKGAKVLNSIKNIFKGLIAIVDIAVQLVTSLVKSIVRLIKFIDPAVGGLLGFAGSIGEAIVALRDFIKESKIFDNIFGTIARVIMGAINGVKDLVLAVVNGFKKLNKTSLKDVNVFGDVVEKRFKGLSNLGNSIMMVFGGIGLVLKKVWGVVVSIGSKIGQGVAKIFNGIVDAAKNADFNTIIDIVNSGLLTALILGINKFLNNISGIGKDARGGFKDIVTSLKNIVQGFSDVLSSVKNAINTFTADIKIGMLKKIATSIAILAAAVFVLSLVDSAKLAAAFGVLTGLFIDLFASMTIFQKLMGKDGFVVMDKLSRQMIAIAVATLILAIAVKKLSTLDWEGLSVGLAGITGIMAPLTAAVKVMSSKDVQHGAKGLLSLAISVLLLTVAVKQFAKLSWDELGRGLASLSAVIVMLVGFTKLADSNKMGAKLIGLAAGILILSFAIKNLSGMSLEQVGAGLLALAGSMAVVIAATHLLPKDFASKAINLMLLAEALLLLGVAFSEFAKLSIDQVGAGLLALAGSLAIIIAALYLFPKDSKKLAGTMIKMAAAITTMAGAMAVLGSIPLERIGSSLLALAGVMAILIASAYAMPKKAAGIALNITLLASAMTVLAGAMAILGSLKLETVGAALLAIAGILTIFAVAVYALQGKELTLLALAGALALLGVSCVAISAAVVAMSTAFVAFAGAGAAAVTMVIAVVTGIVALIPVIIENIGKGIIAFLMLIANSGAAIVAAITTILMSVIESLKTCLPAMLDLVETALSRIIDILINLTPKIMTWLGVLLEGFLNLLIEYTPLLMEFIGVVIDGLLNLLVSSVPKLVSAGIQMILGFLRGIRDGIPQIIQAGAEIIVAFVQGILDTTLYLINAGFRMIIDFVNGLAEAIRGNTQPLIDAFGNLADAMIDGLTQGLGAGISKVVEKAKELANAAWNKIKDILGIHSPSRKFRELGEYSGEGFALGLQDMGSDAEKAAVGIGKGAIKTLSDAVSGIADVVSGDIDTTPTIRPVIDLSDVESGAKEMSGLLGQTQTISVNSSTNKAASVANAMSSNSANGTSNSTNQNGGSVFSFTQNNYSPKALSKVEIYRQTKNQISVAKEAIKSY